VLLTSASFAIQRAADMADPAVDALVVRWKKSHPASTIADADLKRSFMAIGTFAFALVVTAVTGVKPFDSLHPVLDTLIIALALSAGSDGANSLSKGVEAGKALMKAAARREADSSTDDGVVVRNAPKP